jgi:hypothetical protein
MQTIIKLSLDFKLIIFLVILEILTIPIVAITNSIVVNNPIYLLMMGFGAGTFALFVILKLIENPIKKFFSKALNLEVIKVNGTIYIGLLSGFLLMFMFFIQEIVTHFTNNDYIVGLVSAFFSVGITLIIYRIVLHLFNYGIKIRTFDNQVLKLTITNRDIIIITLLFTLYETIASPLSIIWLPHINNRFSWGIISGVAAGIGGGLPLVIISYLTGYKIKLELYSS